jgi:putative cardiolipin synthase
VIPSPRFLQHLLLVALIILGAGCASVDFDAEKSTSTALTDTDDTNLGRYLTRVGSHPPDESGFYLIYDSIDALAIRLLLEKRAERSIDAQYYMVDDDVVGQVFFASLVRAADRGVRVRLLIDDINTSGMEDQLAAMDDHPNIELRLFNPFAYRQWRVLEVWDFSRVNRRMHNKSFTVDNQVTLIGGRNIATEYFARNSEYNFGDLDTLAVGPIVADTSKMFDSYWNHRNAVPYAQLSAQQPDGGERLSVLRDSLQDNTETLRDTPYADAVFESLDEFVEKDHKEFQWAPYQLVYDSPDKSLEGDEGEDATSILSPLRKSLLSASESLLIISPYFVPTPTAIERLVALQQSGVQVDIVTNSLASSDHLLVHGGYAGSRKPLLKHGVRFFEVRGDVEISGTEDSHRRHAKSSLHTKAFVVDRRYFFMGSFNWDPRSAYINTELGVTIDSPKIASYVADRIYAAAPGTSFEVFLGDDGGLRWRAHEGGKEVIYDVEPDTTWFKRFKAGLAGMLPVRGQL